VSTTDLESVPSTATGPDPVLGDLAPEQVRVRFPPSPTGNLHVGNVRSALFNWVFARHYGGTFVLRIEDTDAGRNLAESYRGLMDALTWLGLDWDEGPQVGGPYGPCVQAERGEIYTEVSAKLLESALAYRCFCTREELEERERARPKGSPSGYDGHCRELSADQVAAYEAEERTTWSGARSPSRPSTCPTTSSSAGPASRSTRW
jgi:glutamyl-tRNA synthetase